MPAELWLGLGGLMLGAPAGYLICAFLRGTAAEPRPIKPEERFAPQPARAPLPAALDDDRLALCNIIFGTVEASVDYVAGKPIAVLSDVLVAADALLAAGYRRRAHTEPERLDGALR